MALEVWILAPACPGLTQSVRWSRWNGREMFPQKVSLEEADTLGVSVSDRKAKFSRGKVIYQIPSPWTNRNKLGAWLAVIPDLLGFTAKRGLPLGCLSLIHWCSQLQIQLHPLAAITCGAGSQGRATAMQISSCFPACSTSIQSPLINTWIILSTSLSLLPVQEKAGAGIVQVRDRSHQLQF